MYKTQLFVKRVTNFVLTHLIYWPHILCSLFCHNSELDLKIKHFTYLQTDFPCRS
jgi:hypothetical protein